ncbi:2-keto-4-pentenoate hydratase [Lacrimispora defluvii]|uniref:2-keto-4-pentenoate hydratase n=1 Tax=Lacrimispora defluvii TaxID=2719233 RepID=A0ABX1VPH2_9FIRM|nr:2-keto-4-pentenoate hydratase [Lacrimispora defluvii]NNJ29994.1 2-keto-4-pentenoate hydratase [Lacrimispora defluvii]
MEEKIKKFADDLFKAQENGIPIPPLTQTDPSLSVSDAYAIQLENVKRQLSLGQIVSGKKIGLTSEGIQKQLGVHEPDYGHLFESMEYSVEVPFDRLLQPKIEAEVAFILKEDLEGGNVSPEDVIQATDYVVCAFEIVDSRVADWKIKLPDTIADNASSGCYVLGKKKILLNQVDLSAVKMELYKNGKELVGEGTGAAVLGNPIYSLAWLANCLWNYGVTLKKGEVILSGAFSAAPEAKRGDVFEAHFSTLGSVKASFI